jgi:ribosomal protein S24E
MGRGASANLQILTRKNSKLLDREYIEISIPDKSGRMTRKEAISLLAGELGVPEENVGLLGLEGQSGRNVIVGRFHVYNSKKSKGRIYPRYLDERALSKEEKEKLKQERKKAKIPAAAPEAKK